MSNIKYYNKIPCGIVYTCGDVENAEALLCEKDTQIGLGEVNTAIFKGKSSVILDFGEEQVGRLHILNVSPCGSIRVRFGESVNECCAEIGEKGACNDHSLRNFESSLPMYSDTSYTETGFRFARIDFLTEQTVLLKSVYAECRIFDKPAIYEYSGDDELIRKIYSAAKRTLDLCMCSGYVWDGAKRDRLVWIGDMYPEMLAITTLYGASEELERSLDYIKAQTPLPGWMNGMSTYSLWWIMICCDYCKLTGRREFAKNQTDYMKKLISQVDGCIGEDGSLRYPDLFVDWPTHGREDEAAGVRAVSIAAMKRAALFLKEYGEKEAAETAESINARLHLVPIKVKEAKQVIALKYFAEKSLSKEEADMLIDGGARGFSTFMSYFLLSAISGIFGADKANELMKEYYGAMLSRGATTFFEDFNMDWLSGSGRIDEMSRDGEKDLHGDFGAFCYVGFRHSLCHGWSSGVITFIKESE